MYINPGDRFRFLTVIEFVGKPRKSWLCVCDCGNTTVVFGYSLLNGNTGSCGCKKRAALASSTRTHGMTRTPEYNNWMAMKSRCHNPASQDFALYGGRGIAVCERWRTSFESFLEDMGKRPFPKATVERKDANGDYSPENCRWATQAEQTRNKRTNRLLTLNGVTKCVTVWARELGLNASTLQGRLDRGWPIEQVLSPKRMGKWSRKRGATLQSAKP